MQKYNFLKLKDEFMRGDWVSVTVFFKENEIRNNSRNRTHARGWKKEKLEYERRIFTKTQERFIETEIQTRVRHQKIAIVIQTKGLKRLSEIPSESLTIEQARKLIAIGFQAEQAALGFNSKNIPAIPLNTQSTPQSHYEYLLEKSNYEEILEILAMVRQEKERRAFGDRMVT